jgi:hypothetical protein
VTFPIPFPTNVYGVIPNPTGTASANYNWTSGVSLTGFTMENDGTNPTAFWWAWGD